MGEVGRKGFFKKIENTASARAMGVKAGHAALSGVATHLTQVDRCWRDGCPPSAKALGSGAKAPSRRKGTGTRVPKP